MQQIGVITNPNSRKNKGKRGRARQLQQIVGDHGEVRETRSVEDIKPVLRDFLRRDMRFWVADGGDGALHCMLRSALEVLDEPEFAACELPLALPTNGGTIDFVAKNAGVRGNAEQLLDRLCEAIDQREPLPLKDVETMRVEGKRQLEDGSVETFSTVGFAAAVGGIGQRFFAKYYAADDPCPSEIVRVIGRTLSSMWLGKTPLSRMLKPELRGYAEELFRPTPAELILDDRKDERRAFTGIHVASMGINLGNVFRLFHQANVPGQLHAIFGTPSPAAVVKSLPNCYLGKPLTAPGIYDGPCQTMTVRALPGQELLAPVIDGEYYRDVHEVTFTLGPQLKIPRVVGRLYSN
jgi:diacylglycerol kinase family enzyme